MPSLGEVVSQIVNLAFGLFLIAGGVMGYVHANSIPSLLGGACSGLLMLIFSLRQPRSQVSRVGALLISTFISAFFGVRFWKNSQKFFPAGIGALTGVAVSLLNTVVLVFFTGKPTNKKQ